MAPSPISRALASALALLAHAACLNPAAAGDSYPGGSFGEPYTAYKAGLNFEDNRRPLDGSLRSPPPLAMPGTWTGLYFGGHLGGGVGSIETSDLVSREIDVDTFLGGLHAGYNMQWGNFVGGLEVDGTWTSTGGDSTSEGGLALEAENNWLSSARLRLGYSSGGLLIYATGGLALGGLDVRMETVGAESLFSDTLVGYAAGGGVELKLTDSWIARVEAIHYGFGEETFESSLGAIDADTDVTTIRAGISMRLN